MDFKQNLNYFKRLVLNFGQAKECPYCHNTNLEIIDRKFLFSSLLSCKKCGLSHRHPKDDEKFLQKYYQKEYKITTHLMTTFPTEQELVQLKKENFPQLRYYNRFIDALFSKPVKIIDYGCSWGYNVYKLNKFGYDAVGYELSVPRASFGIKNLGVNIYSETKALPSFNDLIFSTHVIEHLSDIKSFVSLSKSLLKDKGVFMAFCPNGSLDYRNREPDIWHLNWGGVHPNFLTIDFAKFMFANNPYIVLTGDWDFDIDLIESWDGLSQITGAKRDGKELLIISKPNVNINEYGSY